MQHSKGNMAVEALSKWHSCLKMGRAFRACPMALAGIESSLRREDDSEDDETRKQLGRPQESPSRAGLDTAIVRLLDGFRNIPLPQLPGGVPAGKRPAGAREPFRAPAAVAGLPSPLLDLVKPIVEGTPEIARRNVPQFINPSLVEELWRSLISDQVELSSANAGLLEGPLMDILRGKSEEMASNAALRIAESFIGKLLGTGFNPSGGESRPVVSSTPTNTQESRVNARTVGGLAAAGAAATGAGILFKTRGGRGGGRGVSSPSPRGAGGKFFEAGKKFPILNPAR